jgi:rhamnose utilization protein RhaD (predicted bifunctional aldolase and dehydrogenase)/NAD(P)-dependent dehydrogenase (short-subunit alcohol dehydrogenase family)
MKYLEDIWDEAQAGQWESDPLELLRYRSNLLGADLRLTNFGGGNTSAKFELPDPFTKRPVRVLAVKGSGGDLGSIGRDGFALLDLDRFEQLRGLYRGREYEDEMVPYYPLASFGRSPVAPSIDTPLHALLPFAHVDHLHPDWGIALAASGNGKQKLEEFNRRFGRHLLWLPWQRPGFELALWLWRAADSQPDCEGIVLGGHGLFTWGNTSRECYHNSLTIIDRLGQFVMEHQQRWGERRFGGARFKPPRDPDALAAAVLPCLRGKLASERRAIAHYDRSPEVMEFVNARDAEALARLGTSCPDHFVRTRICPLYMDWDPETEDLGRLKENIPRAVEKYREGYEAYYRAFAQPHSPPLRDSNPSVVLVPGLGMFTFGKSRREARITGEFYINAIHVMAGATALGEGTSAQGPLAQAARPQDSGLFTSFDNYVALPSAEAFRIEYWELEEAKLRRLPPEKEFSRKVFLVVGGSSGIGRVTALRLVERGAHVMIADRDEQAAAESAAQASRAGSDEAVAVCRADLGDRASLAAALEQTVLRFGGLDGLINTAAVFFPPDPSGSSADEQWRRTLDINITGNYLLVDEARKVFQAQGLPAVVVLSSSANAVVPKWGSAAYDVSKSAVNHLVRELAVGLAPLVRVNGIAPATVVEGSAMFPRDRVIASLQKYEVPFQEDEPTEQLRSKLAKFYAGRTLTRCSVTPEDCAEAICWLVSDRAPKTTGHVIPVDGGLVEAFLR